MSHGVSSSSIFGFRRRPPPRATEKSGPLANNINRASLCVNVFTSPFYD